MLIIIGLLLVVSVLLISLGGMALKFLATHEIIQGRSFMFLMFSLLRWVVAIFALCVAIAMLYYFGNVKFGEHYRKELKRPNRKGRKYREFVIFSPGTIMATTLFVLGTVAFNTYISNFSRYNALYGSIGTLIILLLWIWVVAILILAGNELNSSIRRNADKLSETETQNRRKEIVIEDLRKHIQTYQAANEYRQGRINDIKKRIEEQNAVIQSLEEQSKDYELIIRAYEEYVEHERRSTDNQYLKAEEE
jgi:membrane protein